MRVIVFYTLIIVYAIHVASCTSNCTTKVIQCPPFTDSVFFKWFPYTDSQKIIFRYLSNEDSFLISSVYISPSTSISSSASNPEICRSSAAIYAKQANNGSAYFSIGENRQDTNYVNSSVSFENFSFYAGRLTDTGFNVNLIDTTIYSNYYSSYILNSTLYSKVQIITKKDTAVVDGNPYRVYFAQGKGVIAYDINVSGKQTWAIQ